MKGYKLKDLKLKEFHRIQEIFDRAFRRQKVEDDKKKVKLKQLIETIPDEEEVSIDALLLDVKSPRIVDWKIHKEGKKSYYQIVRVDGKSQMYMIFSQMLKSFNKEDLEDLYKIIMANVLPPDHVDDLPVVDPNQPNDVPVIPGHVLVDEDEDSKKEEFKEEEEPQKDEDVDIHDEEDENEPELTFPYEEADSFKPSPPTFGSKLEDVIEVEDTVKSEDEIVPASVHEEVIRKGVVFEERPNKDIDAPVKDEKSPIMPPKSTPLTQAAIRRMIKESVDTAIIAERARQANAENNASGSGQARGALELRRWFEKTKMNFGISKYAEDKKVKFAAATLRGPALTWWNSKVVILGLDVANQIGWSEMKKLMIVEFCPAEEV
nr:putative reverse transcriptase domain-containing protein [Tanacetum cinerariifolium]